MIPVAAFLALCCSRFVIITSGHAWQTIRQPSLGLEHSNRTIGTIVAGCRGTVSTGQTGNAGWISFFFARRTGITSPLARTCKFTKAAINAIDRAIMGIWFLAIVCDVRIGRAWFTSYVWNIGFVLVMWKTTCVTFGRILVFDFITFGACFATWRGTNGGWSVKHEFVLKVMQFAIAILFWKILRPTRNERVFRGKIEFGAVQKRAHLVDLEKRCYAAGYAAKMII